MIGPHQIQVESVHEKVLLIQEKIYQIGLMPEISSGDEFCQALVHGLSNSLTKILMRLFLFLIKNFQKIQGLQMSISNGEGCL